MRSIVDKKTAFRAVLLIIVFMAVVSIWPLRLWTTVISSSAGGNRISVEQKVNPDCVISQKFVTQYDRISSIDVYVSGLEKGHYVSAGICDVPEHELCSTFVDISDAKLPGYISIPFEYNVEVGKEYILYIKGCRSKFFVDYTDIPDNTAYVGSLYLNDEEIPGRHLDATYNYRVPMSKKASVIAIAAILAVAAALYAAIGLYFNKFKDRNTLVTVGKVIKYTANPVAALVFGTLMIMVFPLKIFDLRPVDIIFYEIGLFISAFIVFYAINHKVVKLENGVSFFDNIEIEDKVRFLFIMFSMAMTIWHACEYMNAYADIHHTLAERKMVIWFAVMLLFTFSWEEILYFPNLFWLIGSVAYGIRYYLVNALPDTEKEYDLHNAILKYEVIIVVLAGIVAINLIKRLFVYITNKDSREVRFNAFSALAAVLLVGLIVMRYNRWWGVALTVIFGALYLRLLVWNKREYWTKIVAGGLMMNFAISLGYCLLHRYFPGYVSGRFGFVFHTQTVTAEYMIFMDGVAAVLLAAKIIAFPKGLGTKELFKSAWKEMILFGWISTYAIFTVSRTAYLSLFVCIFAVLIIVSAKHKKQFLRMLVTMIVAVVLCFPAVFTLQRIVPAIVSRPVFLFADDADPFVRGGASWGNSNFMCVERFVNLFEDKILGMDVDEYDYPNDILNYENRDGNMVPILDYYGDPVDESDEEQANCGMFSPAFEDYLASASMTGKERFMLLALTDVGYIDENNRWDVLTNGRITIAKYYIPEIGFNGHEDQPTFPSGEIIQHAHNTYLQVAYDHGMVVGALFVLFILCGLVVSYKFYKKNEEKEPLSLLPFSIIIGFTIAGLSEWVFQLSNPMTVALMLSVAPLMYKTGSKS